MELGLLRLGQHIEPKAELEETTLGMQIHVFGNVAVVLAASEMVENGSTVNQDVSGYLLLKDEGAWRIAAHAWDHAGEGRPVPEHLRRT